MEQFTYRAKARIVAIVDLVLVILSLCFPLVVLILVVVNLTVKSTIPDLPHPAIINGTAMTNGSSHEAKTANTTKDADDETSGGNGQEGSFAFAFALGIVLYLIVQVVEFVAIAKLINATTVGRLPTEAAKLAEFWSTCVTVFTIVEILRNLLLPVDSIFGNETDLKLAFLTWSWICIICHCLGIFVVKQFIAELQVDGAKGAGLKTQPPELVILPSQDVKIPMTTAMPEEPVLYNVPQLPPQGWFAIY